MVKKLLHKSCDVATVSYEYALEPYAKLSSHTAQLSNTPERRNMLKTGQKDSITI